MEQALVNLVRNAVEAVAGEGWIRLRLAAPAGRVQIAVEDSGPGLSQEAREHLFVPFFSTRREGQGIGLTLVREIVSRHGFDILVDSPAGGPIRFIIDCRQAGVRGQEAAPH